VLVDLRGLGTGFRSRFAARWFSLRGFSFRGFLRHAARLVRGSAQVATWRRLTAGVIGMRFAGARVSGARVIAVRRFTGMGLAWCGMLRILPGTRQLMPL
jgi:hypothetical protein